MKMIINNKDRLVQLMDKGALLVDMRSPVDFRDAASIMMVPVLKRLP